MSIAFLLMLGQAVFQLPAMPEGTEVRIVSVDLLTVYASAKVVDGHLVFGEFPPSGTEVRVLIFPPDDDVRSKAAQLAGATAYKGTVTPGGADVQLAVEGRSRPLSLREILLEEREIWLDLPIGRSL
ncbi:MAG: hypothetical protein KF875_09485 [Trueperaceae bacterium]|nr:hypothetical protein [Trueperaceae bacterium]MCC6311996.1 hypothetical protein [Trueperaceae bacterium]MCO5174728.1 hypothetical protein [Trueperaceae bacterium]MCW5820468.1 hypothetical protein [Trueperaceae bacterium]